jgi:hypothetical protein
MAKRLRKRPLIGRNMSGIEIQKGIHLVMKRRSDWINLVDNMLNECDFGI